MAKKRKKASGKTALSAADKASLRRILGKVRQIKKAKQAAGLTNPPATSSDPGACAGMLQTLKLYNSQLAAITNSGGLGTPAGMQVFNAVSKKVTDQTNKMIAAGCTKFV